MPQRDVVKVSYIGGVFRSRPVLERFRMLVELTDGCECIPPTLSPAEGALLMAYHAAGVAVKLNIPTWPNFPSKTST